MLRKSIHVRHCLGNTYNRNQCQVRPSSCYATVGREESSLPRFPRMLVEGGVHHVYNRFARGEPVFEGAWEVRRFLSLVGEVKERDGFVILAWSRRTS